MTPPAPEITFIVWYAAGNKEWQVTHEGRSFAPMRFGAVEVGRDGAAGLIGAISWCFRESNGRHALLRIRHSEQEFRLRFLADTADVARFAEPSATHTPG